VVEQIAHGATIRAARAQHTPSHHQEAVRVTRRTRYQRPRPRHRAERLHPAERRDRERVEALHVRTTRGRVKRAAARKVAHEVECCKAEPLRDVDRLARARVEL
jgi:hypothetical protein